MWDTHGHHCLVCGKAITWQFAICTGCEAVVGRSSSEWPAWLVFLWRDYARQRRRDKRIARWEVSLSDLAPHRLAEFSDGDPAEKESVGING